MDKYIGRVLGGRYEIKELIGSGGMALVYRAHCNVLDRFVAIKILKEEFAQDEDFRKRFYNEAHAVAKLSHNNIVSVFDVARTEEGVEYIVMELCEGVSLKEYMVKKGRLSWQETLFFAQQVARALDHAHSRGIIHQDIKPHNVMLLRDGTAKVMDFGIARFANNQETRVVQEAIGSVHYISPEQAKGGTVDFRTDIYSLGIV
ncbi:MAG: protein kinase, partial [Butyricicoccaceae bacterium]